jgi:hypothetical protein
MANGSSPFFVATRHESMYLSRSLPLSSVDRGTGCTVRLSSPLPFLCPSLPIVCCCYAHTVVAVIDDLYQCILQHCPWPLSWERILADPFLPFLQPKTRNLRLPSPKSSHSPTSPTTCVISATTTTAKSCMTCTRERCTEGRRGSF